MKLRYSLHFMRSYNAAPEKVQKAFDKQVLLLAQDLWHPFLRAKKYDEGQDIWQARVTRDWRIYFTIEDDTYHLHEIKSHPK